MGLKIRADWSTDERSKHEDKYTRYAQCFVVLKYENSGTDAKLSFDNGNLGQYPDNTKNLSNRIRTHLEMWKSDTEPQGEHP